MRLIDADALIKTLGIADDCKDCLYLSNNFCGRDNDFVVACEAITDAPTVDAVEVVRCRDCEYYTREERWCRRLGLCGAFNEDDFCSHGERREDE